MVLDSVSWRTRLTAPNTAVSWTQGSSQTVTWDVANTTASPVSCATVDIAMSSGSGFAFPALGAVAFVLQGHVLAAVGLLGVAVAAGLGCASTIALDAKAGAAAWRAELARSPNILAVQPEGYRA